MKQLELEKTYLAKYIPDNIKEYKHKEIIDIYIPESYEHPTLRIRKNADKYEMTKKVPLSNDDFSKQNEYTISLDKEEYKTLSTIKGKRVEKIRYYFEYQSNIAEIDIFQNNLLGLILVDFEFNTVEELEKFVIPDFCLIEVTQEEFLAGGKVCGKTYKDIEEELKRFKYKKLTL